MQNWHVAFNVEPHESGEIRITGFKEGYDPGDAILIPDWIKVSAAWWAKGEIDDEVFVRGIEFMIKEKVIIMDSKIQNEIRLKKKQSQNGLEIMLNGGLKITLRMKHLQKGLNI